MSENNTANYRAGFVAFIGRPNAGKSTLMNALIGQKIAITSDKPQTTRRAIRGILTREHGQLVIVDTPGLHRPRTLLGQRLNDLVDAEIDGVDIIAVCLPADEKIGPGDTRIIEQAFAHPRAKVVAIVTKTDKTSQESVAQKLLAVDGLRPWTALIPVSAVSGYQVDVLVDELIALLPESMQLYGADQLTEDDDETQIAELIRETLLGTTRDELPHSITVVIEEIMRPGGGAGTGATVNGVDSAGGKDRTAKTKPGKKSALKPITKIYASIYVERDSQRPIILGHKGSRLKETGIASREKIEKLLGTKVFLDLRVKISKDWQRDPKKLDRLGF